MTEAATAHELAQIVIRAPANGNVVDIDGLGVFYADPATGCRFEPRRQQIFIAHVEEDRGLAECFCAVSAN